MRSRSSLRFLTLCLTAAVLVAATGLPAFASDTPGEKKGGLSFLDLHRYDLGIYTLIVFGLLCLILYKFAWPKISQGLAAREAVITAARDEAVKVRHEAEEIRTKLQAEFAQANDKIRGLLEEARRDAEALRAKEREAGMKEAMAERERARREIENAKEVALQEIYQQSIKLASMMSSKAIRRQLTVDDQNRLLSESLAELNSTVSRN